MCTVSGVVILASETCWHVAGNDQRSVDPELAWCCVCRRETIRVVPMDCLFHLAFFFSASSQIPYAPPPPKKRTLRANHTLLGSQLAKYRTKPHSQNYFGVSLVFFFFVFVFSFFFFFCFFLLIT